MTQQPIHTRITINPEICGGRPTIRGMRIRVQDVLNLLASGATREEILSDYPYLESDDITAALDYPEMTTKASMDEMSEKLREMGHRVYIDAED